MNLFKRLFAAKKRTLYEGLTLEQIMSGKYPEAKSAMYLDVARKAAQDQKDYMDRAKRERQSAA